MSIIGLITSVTLKLIGINYWLLFGLTTAVLDIIPYVGPILAVIFTSIVTLGTQPDKIYWVIGSFLIIQQIEGNLLIPLIMRDRVQLPEAPLIVLMLILSNWFGVLGAFVAPPLLAVVRTIYLMTYVPRMNQKVYPPGLDLSKKVA